MSLKNILISKVMKKGMLIAGMAMGGLLTLGPLWGILGTVLGMTAAFDHLQSTGVNAPQAVAHDLGYTLLSTAAGFFALPARHRDVRPQPAVFPAG
ncbi:MAG: MotA/TolQ/ExbB proton channel family protein [Chthoniobacteraceae bacterium]